MVQESGLFQREDPVPGLGVAPEVASEAFSLMDKQVSKALNSAARTGVHHRHREEGSRTCRSWTR